MKAKKQKKPQKVTRSKTAVKKTASTKLARKTPSRTGARAKKYSQPGAPWWKAHLP